MNERRGPVIILGFIFSILAIGFIALGVFQYLQIQSLATSLATKQSELKESSDKLIAATLELTKAKGAIKLHKEFEITLQPGGWQGTILGASSEHCGYLVEVTPLELSRDGASIKKCVVQPECNGTTWTDVLRLSILDGMEPLRVNVRVYKVSAEK